MAHVEQTPKAPPADAGAWTGEAAQEGDVWRYEVVVTCECRASM